MRSATTRRPIDDMAQSFAGMCKELGAVYWQVRLQRARGSTARRALGLHPRVVMQKMEVSSVDPQSVESLSLTGGRGNRVPTHSQSFHQIPIRQRAVSANLCIPSTQHKPHISNGLPLHIEGQGNKHASPGCFPCTLRHRHRITLRITRLNDIEAPSVLGSGCV